MKTIPMQGSKADKVVKAFVAMRAIVDMAPLGGLQGPLAEAHGIIFKQYIKACDACQWTESEANRFCSQVAGGN